MSKTLAIIRNNLPDVTGFHAKSAIMDAGYSIGCPENWFELDATITPAARKKWQNQIIAMLQPGDQIVVYDLHCLGLSLSQIVLMISRILKSNTTLLSVKDDLCLKPKDFRENPIFGALIDTEEEIKARQHQKRKKSSEKSGKKAGSPKGLKSSKLDPHKDEIEALLKQNYTKAHIAKIYKCSWPAVDNFIKTRGLDNE